MVRKNVCKALLILSVVTGGSIASAQESTQEADKTVYKKKTVIDFSDVTIEGELVKPEGSYLVNRKKTRFKNLIQIRGDFRPELRQSLENL